jgi:hypothetical protein
VPVTFGQAFAVGAVMPTDVLSGVLSSGATVPLQMDTKATHPDGSVRHAVFSAVIPSLAANQALTLNLVKASTGSTASAATAPTALLNAGFSAGATVNIGGVQYSASADALLRSGTYMTWLSGPIANEWIVSAPLRTAAGVAHPHLTARFAIRSYTGQSKAKVDVTIENNWAYEPNPQNFTYDAQLTVGGSVAYAKTGLTHLAHARWRKELWWGTAPQVHLFPNTAYLMSAKALPNYDRTVIMSSTALASTASRYSGAAAEPMAVGLADPIMGNGGARPDIGLQPGWTVMYLLSGNKDVKDSAFGTATLAGSWPIHYRDRVTDRPLSIVNYPYASLLANPGDMINPATQKSEAFPACTNCVSPNVPDSAHQPDFSYVPYLLSGDYYHLEELQFWAMYNIMQYNPWYRDFAKGLVKSDQVRGQAWAMRTLAEAAYITPDRDALKSQFNTFVANNLDWYNTTYVSATSTATNALGVVTNGSAVVYNDSTGVAPWQDDFFTSAIGRVNELGFTNARNMLVWKAKFPVGRMVDPGFCWIYGSNYSLNVRASATSPLYTSMAQVYTASVPSTQTSLTCGGSEMASALGLQVGEMVGYAYLNSGYPSDMQPALAYSADSGAVNASSAWLKFMQRSVKPDYNNSPQFAIVPR